MFSGKIKHTFTNNFIVYYVRSTTSSSKMSINVIWTVCFKLPVLTFSRALVIEITFNLAIDSPATLNAQWKCPSCFVTKPSWFLTCQRDFYRWTKDVTWAKLSLKMLLLSNRTKLCSLAFTAARLCSGGPAAANKNPTVYFDIAANDTPLGRVTFEVRISHFLLLWNSQWEIVHLKSAFILLLNFSLAFE